MKTTRDVSLILAIVLLALLSLLLRFQSLRKYVIPYALNEIRLP